MNNVPFIPKALNSTIDGTFSCVRGKIDWYTMMFDDSDFITVLKWIGLEHCVDEFLSNFICRSSGYDDQFVFGFEGVSVSTKQFGFFGENDVDENWFYKKFPKVRLDISGTGLDFLRSLGLDVDVYLRDVNSLPCPVEKCRVTRCDFAFDLINFKSTFVDELIDYCNTNATPNNRLCVYNKSNGVSFEVKTGSQKTVYVGSKNSDQMLRVYDKKMQYYDYNANCYKKANEYHDPDSWIRIELQVRKMRACELCFGKGDLFSILRYIHDEFNFSDYVNTTAQNRRPAKFWSELFPWDEIERLMQNRNFVQLRESVEDRLMGSFARGALIFAYAYSKFGPSWIEDFLNKYLLSLQVKESISDVRRLQRVLCRISSYGITPLSADRGLISDGNLISFKF